MVMQDAQKEFEGSTTIGFGIDGGAEEDFRAVRGTFDTNSFVNQLRGQSEQVKATQETMRKLI